MLYIIILYGCFIFRNTYEKRLLIYTIYIIHASISILYNYFVLCMDESSSIIPFAPFFDGNNLLPNNGNKMYKTISEWLVYCVSFCVCVCVQM